MEPHSSLDIRLKRSDKVYRPGDIVEGSIIVQAYKGWSHTGLTLIAEGIVYLSSQSKGIMGLGTDRTGREIQILRIDSQIAPPGKISDGIFEIPFQFKVQPVAGQPLYESYHGVYVSVIYYIQVVCDRGMMKKPLNKDIEFIVEIPLIPSTSKKQAAIANKEPTPIDFNLTFESLKNSGKTTMGLIPKFKITGKLHKTNYSVNTPFTGELTVVESNMSIKAIELQFVRVESVSVNDSFQKESTEVQAIQIADGNVAKNLVIPLYMVFPRLFSSSTVVATQFKVEFEIIVVVIFADGFVAAETFPITLSRDPIAT